MHCDHRTFFEISDTWKYSSLLENTVCICFKKVFEKCNLSICLFLHMHVWNVCICEVFRSYMKNAYYQRTLQTVKMFSQSNLLLIQFFYEVSQVVSHILRFFCAIFYVCRFDLVWLIMLIYFELLQKLFLYNNYYRDVFEIF